ncbi:uncharacterized protein LOC141899119 [Tubulanus polymorphus]|uniref:uncharacterized protein LOC141899119 n=1 Tax=Tubulanus polymorphus TaxID=672921 RepID=UPI003DA25F81
MVFVSERSHSQSAADKNCTARNMKRPSSWLINVTFGVVTLITIKKSDCQCDGIWNQVTEGTEIAIYTQNKTHSSAENHCISQQSHLAGSFGNLGFLSAVMRAISSCNISTSLWHGLYAELPGPEWHWTNKSADMSEFQSLLLPTPKLGNCGFFKDGIQLLPLSVTPCNSSLGYICQRKTKNILLREMYVSSRSNGFHAYLPT